VRSIRLRLTCGAALAAFALTACGGSPTTTNDAAAGGDTPASEAENVYAKLSALAGQERRDELVACAEEEGRLSFYTSMTAEVADASAKGFEDAFDIEVSLYRASSEAVLQRILQEQSAKFAGNDVVETNSRELTALNKEGKLADYEGERRDLVPETGRFEGWTATRFNLFAPSWNTDRIGGVGGPPRRWEDLADPRYDGQLAMEVDDYDWYMTLYAYWQEQGKSETEIDKLFAGMARGAKIVKGHTVMGELLSAGQYAVIASPYTYAIERQKQEGAPVEYQPVVEPVIARPNGIALMKTATNPCSALLFTDWLLEEGQKIIAAQNLTPSITEGEDPLKDIEVIAVDNAKLLDEGAEWSKKYESVVSGGEQAGN